MSYIIAEDYKNKHSYIFKIPENRLPKFLLKKVLKINKSPYIVIRNIQDINDWHEDYTLIESENKFLEKIAEINRELKSNNYR